MNSKKSPLFNIPNNKLHEILEKIANEPIDSFNINTINNKLGPNGICGDYLIPTIEYTTKSEKNNNVTIFLRRPHRKRPGAIQLHHYK